jgi:hypothetical protein
VKSEKQSQNKANLETSALLSFSKGASWRDFTVRKSSIRLDLSYFFLDFYVKMGIIVLNWGGIFRWAYTEKYWLFKLAFMRLN